MKHLLLEGKIVKSSRNLVTFLEIGPQSGEKFIIKNLNYYDIVRPILIIVAFHHLVHVLELIDHDQYSISHVHDTVFYKRFSSSPVSQLTLH